MTNENEKRIEELEDQLKMVLDRESATQLRHDAKTDKLEALIAELEAKLARVIEIANLIAGRMMK
jgi:BMFP domain-containing protein YqiC